MIPRKGWGNVSRVTMRAEMSGNKTAEEKKSGRTLGSSFDPASLQSRFVLHLSRDSAVWGESPAEY